ncbi:MAG: hypothetical protein K2O08_06080 [Clostridia bacterium]|nr:hypothetical protein [Clostridia bacterium]
MSTREMICSLVNDKVPNNELELLYQLILKFVPSDLPQPDEIEALRETENETEFISHNNIDWD